MAVETYCFQLVFVFKFAPLTLQSEVDCFAGRSEVEAHGGDSREGSIFMEFYRMCVEVELRSQTRWKKRLLFQRDWNISDPQTMVCVPRGSKYV
uniref:Uncharacterized protein n=1 Tax=Parascaris equorum TaxID=6256 RepID=A0A914RKH5_PAREQ